MFKYPHRPSREEERLTPTETAIMLAFVAVMLIVAAWPAIERAL